LTATLEVHLQDAATVIRQDPVHILRLGDRRAVDLNYHIALLESDLLLDTIADAIDERALPALDLILGADRWSERYQLDLAQHGDARRVDVGQIDDVDANRDFARPAFDD